MRGSSFRLPVDVSQGIREGKELGPLLESRTSIDNLREKQGAVGLFTQGLVTRQQLYEQIVQLLLGQYLYHKERDIGGNTYG